MDSSGQPVLSVVEIASSSSSGLKETGLPVETGTGGRTKYNRTRLELPKTHWLDAACVGVVDKLQVLTNQPLLIADSGWGNRQMCTPNKQGFRETTAHYVKPFLGSKRAIW